MSFHAWKSSLPLETGDVQANPAPGASSETSGGLNLPSMTSSSDHCEASNSVLHMEVEHDIILWRWCIQYVVI